MPEGWNARIVRGDWEAHFGEFHGGPGSPAGKGDVGINDYQSIGFREMDDVFVVEIMGEHASDGMEFLVEINLMFGSTAFSLFVPAREKQGFIEDTAVSLRPDAECLATGAVGHAETAQLPELLRELRDFR